MQHLCTCQMTITSEASLTASFMLGLASGGVSALHAAQQCIQHALSNNAVQSDPDTGGCPAGITGLPTTAQEKEGAITSCNAYMLLYKQRGWQPPTAASPAPLELPEPYVDAFGVLCCFALVLCLHLASLLSVCEHLTVSASGACILCCCPPVT